MSTFTQLDLFGNPVIQPEPVTKKQAKKPNVIVIDNANTTTEALSAAPETPIVAANIPSIYKQEPIVETPIITEELEQGEVFEKPKLPEVEPISHTNTTTVAEIISFETPTVSKPTAPIIVKRRGRKSQKQMELDAAFINVPSDELLFQKHYYTMGQVCAMFNVNHSLLRYWETEFDILKPRKNRKGDRLFRPEDVKHIEIIFRLTRVKKLTIQGAKDYFKNEKLVAKKFELVQQMEQVRYFLLELKAKL